MPRPPDTLCPDIGAMNLLCAHGLPGSEDLDVLACREWLRRAAEYLRERTERRRYLYDRNPDTFGRSEAIFLACLMVEGLQLDLGVRYRMDLVEADDRTFFSRADHLFIHGIIQGGGGTCSSLPP